MDPLEQRIKDRGNGGVNVVVSIFSILVIKMFSSTYFGKTLWPTTELALYL
jgi:hypothetical protein